MKKGSSPNRLTATLFILVVTILIVQNFFLVQKTRTLGQNIERLKYELNARSAMNVGDSVSTFKALRPDSTIVVISPTGAKKRLMLVFSVRCGACKMNMPQWNHLVQNLSKGNVEILGICPDSAYKLRRFVAKESLSFSTYSISNDTTIRELYKWNSFPQTILINAAGKVEKITIGILSDSERDDFMMLLENGTENPAHIIGLINQPK